MSEPANKNWALIPRAANLPAQVQVAGRQLAIAAQLSQDIERGRLVAIVKRISSKNAVFCLSRSRTLDSDLIERFAKRWDWRRLSSNTALPWSIELIERYIDRWDWCNLTGNESLPWSVELIERYIDRWNMTRFGWNIALPWSIELIERYEDRWRWNYLSSNTALPWSIELIERYEDRWDWGSLSSNKALPWSVELIERYIDRWIWGLLAVTMAPHLSLLRSTDVVEIMTHHFPDKSTVNSTGLVVSSKK